MNITERDALIAKLLEEGIGLSDVQKVLETEHDVKITYMELRLISADLKVSWEKQDAVKQPKPAKKPADGSAIPAGEPGQGPVDLDADDPTVDGDLEGELLSDDEAGEIGGGTTTVTISKIQRPGAVVSGDVTFKSGITADWYVDQMGRLGLNPHGEEAQPTPDDIQDFQAELQRMIQSGAMG